MEIKVLISAPGDQLKQVEATKRALESLSKILSPHGHSLRTTYWKTNVSTGSAERAQDVINSQITDCDVMVAILGDRIGTPTGEFASGTVEEIELFLSRRHDNQVRFDVHVFFNRSHVDPFSVDVDQLRNVQNFRRSLNTKGVNFGEFASLEDLSEMVQLGVSTFIARSPELARESAGTSNIFEDFDELGFDDAIELATEDMTAVVETLTRLHSDTQSWNAEISKLADEGPTAMQSDNSKEFFERVATALENSKKRLSPQVTSIEKHLASSHARMNYALTLIYEDVSAQNPDEWVKVISILESSIGPFVAAFQGALQAVRGARDAVNSLPRRRTTMNRAKRELVHEYDRLIEIMGSTISKFSTLTLRN